MGYVVVKVDDDVAQQGQVSGAVVRQAKAQRLPMDPFPPAQILLSPVACYRCQGAGAGEVLQLLGVCGMEAPLGISFRIGVVAEGNDQQPPRRQELADDPEGSFPLAGRQMHPDRTDQDQIKSVSGFTHAIERREAVIEPRDIGVVLLPGQLPEGGAGLNCNDVPALARHPVGVSATRGPYVTGKPGARRQQVAPLLVQRFRIQTHVVLVETPCVLVVPGRGGHGGHSGGGRWVGVGSVTVRLRLRL